MKKRIIKKRDNEDMLLGGDQRGCIGKKNLNWFVIDSMAYKAYSNNK